MPVLLVFLCNWNMFCCADFLEFFFSYLRGGHGSRNSHPSIQDCLRLLGQWMTSAIAGRVTATHLNEAGIKAGAAVYRRFIAEQVARVLSKRREQSAPLTPGFSPTSPATGAPYVRQEAVRTTHALRLGLRRQANVRLTGNDTSRGTAPWPAILAPAPPAAAARLPGVEGEAQYADLDSLTTVSFPDNNSEQLLDLLGSHGAMCDAALSAVAESLVPIDTGNGQALRDRFKVLSSVVPGGSMAVSPLQAFASDALCITAAAFDESGLLKPVGRRQLTTGGKPWSNAMSNALRFVVTELLNATARANMLKLALDTVGPQHADQPVSVDAAGRLLAVSY